MAQPKRIDAGLFERVASRCKWQKRSLKVVRAILVDGVSIPESAAACEMSVNQARVLLARFNAKADKLRAEELEEFMSQEAPRHFEELTPYSEDVKVLRASGYTIEQVVTFFKQKNINTSASTVRRFLRSIQE